VHGCPNMSCMENNMLISHFFRHVGPEVPVQLQHRRNRVAQVALANAAVAPESVTIEPWQIANLFEPETPGVSMQPDVLPGYAR
jgi:hypothetical protein